jgi:hypothetical protein
MAGQAHRYLSSILSRAEPTPAPEQAAAGLSFPVAGVSNSQVRPSHSTDQAPVQGGYLPPLSVRPRLSSNIQFVPIDDAQPRRPQQAPHPLHSLHLPPRQAQGANTGPAFDLPAKIQSNQRLFLYHQNSKKVHQERMRLHQSRIDFHLREKTNTQKDCFRLLELILEGPCDSSIYGHRCQLEQKIKQHQARINHHEGRLNHHRLRAHHHSTLETNAIRQHQELVAMTQKTPQHQQHLPPHPSRVPQIYPLPLPQPNENPATRIQPISSFLPSMQEMRSHTEQRLNEALPLLPRSLQTHGVRPGNLQIPRLNYPIPERTPRPSDQPRSDPQNSASRIISFHPPQQPRQRPPLRHPVPKMPFLDKKENKKVEPISLINREFR